VGFRRQGRFCHFRGSDTITLNGGLDFQLGAAY